MRTGIFGGTFNPFHNGHKKALESFISEQNLDRCFIVPAFVSPFKTRQNEISDEERLEIIRLSVKDVKNAVISDFEIKSEGKSYTYLTVEKFKNDFPEDELFLYLGTDMFLSFDKWKNPEKITKNATLCGFMRNEDEKPLLIKQKSFLEKNLSAKCVLGSAEPFPVSSTEIREKIKAKEDFSALVSKNAEKYIKENHLYILPSEEFLLSKVKPMLKEERFLHTLGVRDEMETLAKIYGADVKKARICGILHDITKNMPDSWHLDFIKEHNIKTDGEFLKVRQLYHSLTGSVYVKDVLGIFDEEIISAIRYHSTAKPEMTLLEKLLYVADFTEINRNYGDVSHYRALARKDIDRCVYEGLSWNVEFLKQQNRPIYKDTLSAEEYYKNLTEKKG